MRVTGQTEPRTETRARKGGQPDVASAALCMRASCRPAACTRPAPHERTAALAAGRRAGGPYLRPSPEPVARTTALRRAEWPPVRPSRELEQPHGRRWVPPRGVGPHESSGRRHGGAAFHTRPMRSSPQTLIYLARARAVNFLKCHFDFLLQKKGPQKGDSPGTRVKREAPKWSIAWGFGCGRARKSDAKTIPPLLIRLAQNPSLLAHK